jgi:hypothetical protein
VADRSQYRQAAGVAKAQLLAEGTSNGKGEKMIRLMTTFLTLGMSIATAATANAQDGFFGNCNPNSTRCRLLNNPQQQTVSTQSHKGYAKHHHAKQHKAHAQ